MADDQADAAPGRVERDTATARTLISGALLAELGRRVYEYENTITWNTDCTSCARVLDSAYAETMRREAAEAKLAEIRSVLLEGGQGDATARCRAIAIVGTGEVAQPEPLSATCTGPDCGQMFMDSETGEYLFATRERMERLLHADGWQVDPVLCPPCQPEAGHDPLA
jgi:hypothetical protein